MEKIKILDKLIYVAIIILLGILPPDLFMIGVYVFIYFYMFLTGRRKALPYILLSTIYAIIWVYNANGSYGYNQEMLVIFKMNALPLFAWASGLFGAYFIYAHFERKLKKPNFFKELLLFAVIYWVFLLGIETVAYHVFNIQNIATANTYPGLPFCDCIHTPKWMQTMYLLNGPIYFTVCKLLRFENPLDKSK